MTVKQMIEKLKEFPEDMQVFCNIDEYWNDYVDEISIQHYVEKEGRLLISGPLRSDDEKIGVKIYAKLNAGKQKK